MQSTTTEQLGISPLTRMFRALGDETRLRIIALLTHGELCVCHLETALELSQPNVSRQLGILRMAGLVEARREGSWVYYSLAAQQHDAVKSVLEHLVRNFGAETAIRNDVIRLRTACGPDACK